jgi:Tol biopolymer transport system component
MTNLALGLAIVLLVGGCAAPRPPEIASVTAETSTMPGPSAAPSSSPSGDLGGAPIALVSDADGGAGIYLVGPGGARTRVSPSEAPAVVDFAPVWSPSGDRIAHHRIEADGNAAVYVTDPATGDQRRVAAVGPPSTSDPRVSWSPDGSRLAFWSTAGSDNEIQVVNLADEAVSTVSPDPSADRYPAWSPTDDLLAFWSDRSGRGAIWLAAPDGSGLRQLVEVGSAAGPVAWAPDGTSLAVALERPGPTWQIRIVDLEGTTLGALEAEGGALAPAWSPDGSRLAYLQLIGPARQLWVADRSGANARSIGPPPAIGRVTRVSHPTDRWPSPPSWSPLGDVVVAEWPDGDRLEVIAVDVDGDTWLSLTPAEANDGSPAWRPTLLP